MDDLGSIRRHALRFSAAAELAQRLDDALADLDPRHSVRPSYFLDSARASATEELYQAKGLLQEMLQKLDERRNFLLPPIARLNDDVLRMIFLYATLTTSEAANRAKMAIRISLVSRHWRSLALNTAGIWVDLVVPPSPRTEAIRAFTSRSQAALLELTIVGSQPDYMLQSTLPHLTLTALGRLRSLKSDELSAEDVISLLGAIPHEVRALEKVALTVVESLPTDGPFDTHYCAGLRTSIAQLLIDKAPNVQDFDFVQHAGPPVLMPHRVSLLSCRKLALSITSVDPSYVLVVMSNSPNLRYLALTVLSRHGWEIDIPLPPEAERFTMENLEYVMIHAPTPVILFAMQLMRAPQLGRLFLNPSLMRDIHLPHSTATRVVNAVSGCLQASSAPLHELGLDNIICGQYQDLLSGIPTLEQFTCALVPSHPVGAAGLFDMTVLLTPGPHNDYAAICPKLNRVKHNGDCLTESLEAILQMVRRRLDIQPSDPLNIHQLRRFELTHAMESLPMEPDPDDLIIEIDSLLEEGFVVEGYRIKPNRSWTTAMDV